MGHSASKGRAFLVIFCQELLFSNFKKHEKRIVREKNYFYKGKLLFTILSDLMRMAHLKKVS